ncbi:MAG TPA: response regulator [Candidatus Eisenbacteria bacterium]|nr:response regulator [Candidatus Eisenbacteria bacterium]
MSKAKILIVEDEFVVAEDLASMLANLGYEVVGRAAEGGKAIALACAVRPDLILMDVRLNGLMDGIEATERIRQACDVPVVFLTAHSDSRTLERAQMTEPFGYILKPFSERELNTQIQLALYKHRTEQALRRANASLEQQVAERTKELMRSRERLRALVSELTLAGERERRRVAVELHDHLTQLLVVSRMGVTRAKQLVHDPKLAQALAETDESLEQALRYTRTLMAELSPRVLYELGLPSALQWLGEQMQKHGLEVQVKILNDSVPVSEDQAIFMFQCVRELLWNVIKHAGTRVATVTYQPGEREITIAVADRGKGFDPAVLQRGPGLGGQFGLFSIRERLELQGGGFEVTSSPGQGASVTLKLPRAAPKASEVASMAGNYHLHQRNAGGELPQAAEERVIRVALVDDHQMVRQGLRSVLEEYPELAVVGEAANGLEAIEIARKLEPDVVVMDLNLPIVNGIEATRRIMQERPSTIVIGLSFGSDAYVLKAMKAAGAVTCITKERAVEELYRTIKSSVELQAAIQARA